LEREIALRDSLVSVVRSVSTELEHLQWQLQGFNYILEKYKDSLLFWRGEAYRFRFRLLE